ncbi:MAG: hypothetical protein ACK50Q_01025 [Labrys sp. (in: a-proteobacteria)]
MSYGLSIMDKLQAKYGPEGGRKLSALDKELHKFIWLHQRLIEVVDDPRTDKAERRSALEFSEMADCWSMKVLGFDLIGLEVALRDAIIKALEEVVSAGAAGAEASDSDSEEDLELPQFDDPEPEGTEGRTVQASNAVDPWAHLRH